MKNIIKAGNRIKGLLENSKVGTNIFFIHKSNNKNSKPAIKPITVAINFLNITSP